MNKKFVILMTLGYLSVIPVLVSAAMTSPNFQLKTSVMSGAGGIAGSANYQIQSVLGQSSPIMLMNNAPVSVNFILFPGFIYTIPLDGCPYDLDMDGDVDGKDLTIFILGFPGAFDTDNLIDFAGEFGKTECK